MSEPSPGENNIESLAERAKEMLERVRAHNDGPSSHATSEALFALDDDLALDDKVAFDDDVEPLMDADEEPLELELEEIEDLVIEEDLATEEDLVIEEDLATEEDLVIEEVEPDDDRLVPMLVPAATGGSGVEHLFAEEPDENDPNTARDRRRFGGLLPLLLLALVVLAVLLFLAAFFGSDDEDSATGPSLVDQPDEEASSTDAPNTSESVITTQAPSTTGTTTTTAEPQPDPTIPETAWALLGEETGTAQFAALGTPLGLREALEASIDENGEPIELTLFAPSDAAIQTLTSADLEALALDSSAAAALIDYHIVDQRLTPELLLESAGSQLQTRAGLPIDVSVDGDDIVLNGSVRLSIAGLTAGNGAVHVIDGILQPPTLNTVLDIGNIQFEVRSSTIAPAGEVELQKAIEYFEANPEVKALIEGHTDTDGPSEPNQRLSERRANAVREFLISKGIDGSRLESVGLGEADPILEDGVEDKVASRRIDFIIR